MNTTLETIPGIHLGDRGEKFKRLIANLLKKAKLKKEFIDILTNESSMTLYSSAFTSEQVDKENNYQVLEQLGDLSGNKFIVYYIYNRFPQLRCAEGVKVAARLRINYGAKNSFSNIAEKLGFWVFITATNDDRQRKKKPLLEDVFEAFLGATEMIVDESTKKIGAGYACVYRILKVIFDEMDISLAYEDLYDAKTRLKELFDARSLTLGPLSYEEEKQDLITISTVYRLEGAGYEVRADGSVNMSRIVGKYKKIKIGEGCAALKADAQQMAAKDALENLAQQGIVKSPPAIYAKFVKGKEKKSKTTIEDVLSICKNREQINELFPTMGKAKKNKYLSTVLAHFCREKDKAGIKICLSMGADPNSVDTLGMTCSDLLLIGSFRPKLVRKSVARFSEVVEEIEVHQNVFERYMPEYQLTGVVWSILE